MRVFMLGWEFPPFITGGLGTACHGLTRAMDAQGIGVTFVMPGGTDPTVASHVDLLSPKAVTVEAPPNATPANQETPRGFGSQEVTRPAEQSQEVPTPSPRPDGFSPDAEFIHLPVQLRHPYDPAAPGQAVAAIGTSEDHSSATSEAIAATGTATTSAGSVSSADSSLDGIDDEQEESAVSGESKTDYSGDIMAEVRQFSRFARDASRSRSFDVIHAHDWMTYPAGLEVARRTGKPLVVHVHSTEFDRSGEQVNQQIYDIERRGMHGAMRVITVSRLTRNIAVRRYGVNPDKVTVVYNGVAIDPIAAGARPIGRREKIVLYFGRITRQKGPEYFIRSAARVLEVEPHVRFIVAGSGDLYRRCIELAAELGIGQHFLFTGFLRGPDIEKVFQMADLFVMPSVSEPFGIAPLEAMGHDVPVLISKSSGASEVLTHALKCDFWDTEAMADKIVAVLRHPPLGQTLRRHGVIDIKRLTWADAAAKCGRVYEEVAAAMVGSTPSR
ncbi:MAG: glycosyltransferase [Planctomycetes bacterium]|nr:glycosyltransferase [Planctomycetota bacterium]MCP4838793.1 glycosyltransferase [Planctomycetota bacterium]